MSLRTLTLSLLAAGLAAPLCGGFVTARAADLDPSFADLPPPVAEEKVEFGTGWYIRGDIGASHGLAVNAGDEPYSGIYEGPGQAAPPLSAGGSDGINYTGSLGAGYQVNRWFRTDLVFDFHQPVQNSQQGVGRGCITGTAGVGSLPYQHEIAYTTTCTPTLKATLKSYDVLANGYFDIGTWHSITPYVGAGIGLSFGHAQASSKYIQGNDAPYDVSYTDAVNGATYNQYWDRSESRQYYNFAFALMGGVAIDVFDHTKLDIGYRYLHLGSVLGTNLATQEVRVGLRYMIDN